MSKQNVKVKQMVLAATFIALAIVLKTYVSIPLGTTSRISIWPIPLILVGSLCGLRFGLVAGLVTDLIYAVLFPGNIFNPFFTISAMSWGLCGYFLKNARYNIITTFALLLAFSLLETTINTIGLYIYQGSAVFANVPSRLLITLIRWPIISTLIFEVRIKTPKMYFSEDEYEKICKSIEKKCKKDYNI